MTAGRFNNGEGFEREQETREKTRVRPLGRIEKRRSKEEEPETRKRIAAEKQRGFGRLVE